MPYASRLQFRVRSLRVALAALAALAATATPAPVWGDPRDDARAAEKAGDAAAAAAAWQKVAEADPQDFTARVALGRIQTRLGQSEAAIQTLTDVLIRAPKTPRIDRAQLLR